MLAGLLLVLVLSACGSQQSAGSTPVPFSTVTGPRGTEVARTVFPYGPIPHGWKTYRGLGVPFALAYPPHWSVDESNAPVGQIGFKDTSKKPVASGEITTRDLPQPPVGLALLRSRFLAVATRVCEGGRRVGKTGTAHFARTIFATVTAACSGGEEGKAEEESAFYLGVAVKGSSEWTFNFRCPSDDLSACERRYFVPMLRTLHIYKRS